MDGFTLIELLIVLAIIGILLTVAIPNMLQAKRIAIDSAAQSYARNIVTKAEIQRTNSGTVVYQNATNCQPGVTDTLPSSVETCQLRQDANITYVLLKSRAGHYFYFNGEFLQGPLTTAPASW